MILHNALLASAQSCCVVVKTPAFAFAPGVINFQGKEIAEIIKSPQIHIVKEDNSNCVFPSCVWAVRSSQTVSKKEVKQNGDSQSIPSHEKMVC